MRKKTSAEPSKRKPRNSPKDPISSTDAPIPVAPAPQAPAVAEKPTGPRDYVFVRQVTTQYTYRVSAKTRAAAKRWVDSCSPDAADEKKETRSVFLSQKEKKKPTTQLSLFGGGVP